MQEGTVDAYTHRKGAFVKQRCCRLIKVLFAKIVIDVYLGKRMDRRDDNGAQAFRV